MAQTIADTTEGNWGTIDLTAQQRHELLRPERRRVAIRVLDGRRPPISLDAVAAAVAAAEGTDCRDDEAVSRVGISLHHRHLPKLAEHGLIDYDAESNQITGLW